MKIKKTVALLVAAIMLLSLLAACGSKTGEGATSAAGGTTSQAQSAAASQAPAKKAVTISILTGQGAYKSVFDDMTKAITADTGYSIDWQVIPDDQYYNLAKAKVATNEVPDIIEYNTPSNNIELNASVNAIPLDNEPWAARLVNPALLKDPVDGKIYAMPRDAGTFFGGVYFNKKTLDSLGVSTEQPKTYAEFVDRLEQIKTKSGGKVAPIYASNKDSWTTQIFMTLGFAIALYPNDKDAWNKLLKNEKKFTDYPEFAKVMADYKDLYTKGYVNKDNLSATYDMAKEAVATGKAAMALQGEWFVTDVQAKWPDTEFGAWVTPYGDKLIMGTGAYVRGWFLMKNGKQVEETRNFMNIWSSPKYMNMLFAALPGFPAFKDVDGGKVDASVKMLVDNYLSTNKYTYQINDPMGVVSPVFPELWKMYVEMVASNKTPKTVLQNWQKKYEDYMKQKQQPGF